MTSVFFFFFFYSAVIIVCTTCESVSDIDVKGGEATVQRQRQNPILTDVIRILYVYFHKFGTEVWYIILCPIITSKKLFVLGNW